MKKLILFISLSLALIGCPNEYMDTDYRISLKNNSFHSVKYYLAWPYNESETVYPDTSLPNFDKLINREIQGGNSDYLISGKPWEDVFKDLPQDTMSLFIFHTDTLKKYSWQEVRDGYKVLKRYDLSLEDIKRMNYTITYP